MTVLKNAWILEALSVKTKDDGKGCPVLLGCLGWLLLVALRKGWYEVPIITACFC